MKARVSSEYTTWYAEQVNELFYDDDVLNRDMDVLGEYWQGSVHHCYQVQDANGHIHPSVPAEFVTIIE